MKILFYGTPHVQGSKTEVFLSINFFHKCIGVPFCTNLLGLGVKTLLFNERYLLI